MVFSLPHSAAISDVSAANAAAGSAISSPSAVSGQARLFTSAAHANNFRLTAVYSRLSVYLNGGARFETSDVIGLCYTLAKAIDCSLTLKDIPGIASRLPPLVKKVYEWRKQAALQSAIMMVLISMKNACKRGWFQPADSGELLCIVDEMCSKFCTELCPNDQANYALETISKIMPKFYPRLKLCGLIAAFVAKPGYDVLMSDFHFPKNKPTEQKIVLVVLKTENLETSSCIASPPQASFLINGRGVEKRNTVSLDCGPQFPTDISKMLKYGINVLQTIGYFDGTYLIAVAYMSKMTPFTLPTLKDFVQPVVAALDSDSEIIEGPSRISLNCPISFKRITIPVKGHLCKHHQCFDYVNFMEMNSRKPSWHCPYCNQPVCMIDLRIDRNMVKILEEVGKDVAEVIIHADSSWNVVAEHKRDTNLLHNGAHVHDQADMECEANRPRNSLADPVDLTMEEEVSLDGSASQICKLTSENEDRKPFIGDGVIPVSQFVAHPQLSSHAPNAAQISAFQMGNVMQPTFMSSYAVNGVAASFRPPLGISQALSPNVLTNHFTSDVISPVLGQTPLAVHSLPVMGEVSERIKGRPTPRHDDRTPIAVQPLPMPQSTPSTSRRLQANSLETVPSASNNLSPNKYQTVHTSTAALENFNGGIGNMDLQQVTRTPNTSAIQDHAQENHHYVPNAAVRQQVGGLPLPNSTNDRGLSLRRGPTDLDAFLASVQPSSFSQNFHQTPPGFWTHHSISQAVNVLPQSPSLPLAPWLVSQNTLASGNFGNQRSQTQAPLPAQLSSSLSTSAANSQPSRDNSRIMGADRWRNLTGGTPPPLSRSDVFQELPSEQHNSMPTRTMRGRLTGNDYSAVLSRYMAPTGQPPTSQSAITRPPFSSIPPTAHDQVSALIANNLMAHGAASQQANLSQDNFGTQQGDACI